MLPAGLFGVLLDVVDDPLDQGVAEPLLDRSLAPGLVGLGPLPRAGPERVGQLDQALGGVGPAVEEDVLDARQQLRLDLLVDVQLPGVDDGHVQPGPNRVVEERRVHGPAHRLAGAEREGDVAHAAGDLHVGKELLDLPGGLDEAHGVAVVLLDAGADGQDVGVEDDVLRRHPHPLGQQVVRPARDADLVLDGDGLARFVEHHHHAGGAVASDQPGVAQELLLALLEADRVDDRLALHALQARFEDRPLGAVDHHGHAGDVRLGGHQVQQVRHDRLAVDQPVVDVHVDDVGPVFDLLPGDAKGLLEVPVADQARKPPRAGDVGPLADHREAALGREHQRLQAGVARVRIGLGGAAGRNVAHGLGNRRDVRRRGAAAAADDVQPAVAGELAEHPGHLAGRLVVGAELVG